MLLKYRSGVVHSTRNISRMCRTDKVVVSRPIIHMRSSFTLKKSMPTWPPTIKVNQSMHITGKNNIITLADYHPVFKNSSWGICNHSSSFIYNALLYFI
jgi:hypothetical protein